MKLRHYTYHELVRRPGRTLLTLAGIVIGVGGVFAISLVVNTTRHAYQQMFGELTGQAALEVVAEGGGGFDPAIAQAIAALPGIHSAEPTVQQFAGLVTDEMPLPVMVVGTDSAALGEIAGRIVGGDALANDDEILLVDSFARATKLTLGGTVRMLAPRGGGKYRIVGLVEPRGMAGFNGGAVVFVSLRAARSLFGLENQVTSIPLVLEEQASESSVRAAVAELLPPELAVRSPASRGEMAQHSLIGAEQGLSSLSAVAVVAGAFVILNSFLMSLGERRRQLAILRAIGVTRSDVTRLLLREAILLGIVGMAIAIVVGYVTALALMRGMEQLMGITLRGLEVTWQPFLLAALFGPGMAVAATLAPARAAARRPLLVDLLGLQSRTSEATGRRMVWCGVALSVISTSLVAALVTGRLPEQVPANISAPLMGMVLISGILLSPGIHPRMARLVSRMLAPVWGIEGRLAARQVERNTLRSSLTAAVLCVALIVSIAMGQSIRNNIRDVEDWSERTFTADYLLRGALPELSYTMGVQLPEAMHDELRQVPGVAKVEELNLIQVKAGDESVIVLARSYDEVSARSLDVAEGDRDEVARQLLAGEAVVGTALAQRLKLSVGDSLPLRTRRGTQKVRIAGKVTEYVAGGMALYLERGAAKRLFHIDGVDVYMVAARPDALESVGQAMQALAAERGLMMQSNAEFRDRIRQMIGGVTAFLWLLMALVFVVASLGIVNTLTMNVLEQTREIAVLRAVAMRRGQVRAMVLFQALSLALGSLPMGVGGGLVLAYLMNLSTHVLIGQLVDFRADWWFVAGCAVACLLIATAAAWFPARRASRLGIVRALQYE